MTINIVRSSEPRCVTRIRRTKINSRTHGVVAVMLLMPFLPILLPGAETLPTKNLVTATFGGGKQPQVAVTPSGTIVIVFVRGSSIYSVMSTDEGRSFSEPSKIADQNGLISGMGRGPRVAATDKRIMVSAPGKDLFSYLSEDGGKSWSPPVMINDQTSTVSEGLHNVTALPDGSFYATWLDREAGKGVRVDGARLDPGAKSWNKSVTVYASPERTVCECCHPSVAADETGRLVIMWRNSLEGNRDMYVAESKDRGNTFATAVKLGTGSWALKACPMDGGAVTSTPEGTFAVWRRRTEINLSAPGQLEVKLGEGTKPVLARTNGAIQAVWQESGNLVVKSDRQKDEGLRVPGGYASLTASPDRKQAYLVWEAKEGEVDTLKFAVLH